MLATLALSVSNRMEKTMRKYLIAVAISLTSFSTLASPTPAAARDYKWCGVNPGNGGRNCGFTNHRQCMVSVSGGGGGYCERNNFYHGGHH